MTSKRQRKIFDMTWLLKHRFVAIRIVTAVRGCISCCVGLSWVSMHVGVVRTGAANVFR